MLSAMVRAAESVSAPSTRMVMNFDAPSPSRTTCWASSRHRSVRADWKASAPALDQPDNGVLAAAPVAKARTVSEVEVSPSMVMQLKLC